MYISQSVGSGAPNQKGDVRLVQALLNLNLSRMTGISFLTEDGGIGPRTQAAIEAFQTTVATPGAPSGVIEPGSATLAALRSAVDGLLNANVLRILMPLSTDAQANKY